MNRPRTWIVAGALAVSLSACSLVAGKREALTVYAPHIALPANGSSVPAAPRRWQLWVAEPATLEPLAGTRIVVVEEPGTLQFYRGARWSDEVPVMMQRFIVDGLREYAGVTGVGTPSSGLTADYVLRSDLHGFQIEFRGAPLPTATIQITAQLVDASNGQVLASRRFVEDEACADAKLPGVYAAFQAALNRIVMRIADWTASIGDAHFRDESTRTR
ncbi:ABC-type transport auxiliary lipoprotein family protein [Tahibacter soli]|uniref:ABC-type transport auxiliary lipoprotein family protein n=1 Tax=Tahibacter soli TaxID=2983605 RepID=A0A9X3YGC5_9GAMM|nr:ABC-type transport auxiliary lipoprotein family protein [Tahibacter soli]MDC8011679.1 ABC-type transport auxiliary lipoprotein family protein [Tahibacter soli]